MIMVAGSGLLRTSKDSTVVRLYAFGAIDALCQASGLGETQTLVTVVSFWMTYEKMDARKAGGLTRMCMDASNSPTLSCYIREGGQAILKWIKDSFPPLRLFELLDKSEKASETRRSIPVVHSVGLTYEQAAKEALLLAVTGHSPGLASCEKCGAALQIGEHPRLYEGMAICANCAWDIERVRKKPLPLVHERRAELAGEKSLMPSIPTTAESMSVAIKQASKGPPFWFVFMTGAFGVLLWELAKASPRFIGYLSNLARRIKDQR